jgi:hypothetical protein
MSYSISIVGNDDFRHAAKLVVLKIYGNVGRVSVESIPNQFRNGNDGRCLCLPFQKVRLDLNAVFLRHSNSDQFRGEACGPS